MQNSTVIDGVIVLIPPPPGYQVDFANPTQRLDITAYVVFIIGFPLSTLCFLQNAYVKLRIFRAIDAELVCLTLGWILASVMEYIQIQNFASKIIGVHVWETPILTVQKASYFVVVVTALNAAMTGFCKTSLGIFYFKLSPQIWWKWASGVSLLLLVTSNLAMFVVILIGCQPIQKNWTSSLPGSCIDRVSVYIARAVIAMVSDLVLLILPIPMIIKLQIPRSQKIGLCLFFAIGSVTFITAAIRIQLVEPTRQSEDLTWTVASSGVLILAESHLIVICASLPTLKRFCAEFSPRIIGESRFSTKKSSAAHSGSDQSRYSTATAAIEGNRKRIEEFGSSLDRDDFPLKVVYRLSRIEEASETQCSLDEGSDQSR